MCGRSVKLALLFFLLVVARPARAREQTFATGLPLGIGFAGGIEGQPGSSFAAGAQTSEANYAKFFAAEPFIELGNVQLKLHAGWHLYPLLKGSGTDNHGAFTESSDASSLELGARILLAPWVAESMRARAYFFVGAYDSKVSLTNERSYSSGGLKGQTNSAKVSGSGTEVNGGLGFEFFLVQNYSLALEAGYRSVSIDSFHYGTTTDETGTTISSGATATNGYGVNKGWHSYAAFGQLVLNLNL